MRIKIYFSSTITLWKYAVLYLYTAKWLALRFLVYICSGSGGEESNLTTGPTLISHANEHKITVERQTKPLQKMCLSVDLIPHLFKYVNKELDNSLHVTKNLYLY